MNIEQLRRLSPEDQRRYIEVEKRFESETWAWVREWALTQIADAEKRAAHAEDWPMNRMNMGAVGILQLLLAQEETAYQEFELLLDEAPQEDDHVGDLQL